MTAFETLVQAVEEGCKDDGQLSALMWACLEDPAAAVARQQLREQALGTATVAALYAGYRTIPLGRCGKWHLSLTRISDASDHVPTPICRSVALCIESDGPVRSDEFCDDVRYDLDDMRPEEPIRHVATRFVETGDLIKSFAYDRWSALSGTVNASFLKLETATERPITIAFDRESLEPVSIGFADHQHTARHFVSGLLHHLAGREENIMRHMPEQEVRDLRTFLEGAAHDKDTHLLTRWKYVQALGCLDGPRAREALRDIADQSTSRIGAAARQLLAGTAAAA